ncbi:MAG TPA: TadE family protein [Pyrinomonadaceae bacterium]|jgi:Flp pilus assembly protein TadG
MMTRKGERGAALLEFAIGATVFLTITFGVLELGRLLWVHNALADATRRGARYAVNQPQASAAAVQNVAVYGNTAGTGTPLVSDLTPAQIVVTYSNFGLATGTVKVEIQNYDFKFVLPLVGTTIRMPAYSTTLTGENAGWVPNPI